MKNPILATAIAGIIGIGTAYANPDFDRSHPGDSSDCYHMKYDKPDHHDDDQGAFFGPMMRELDLSEAQRKELKTFRDEMRDSGKDRRKEMHRVRREIHNLDPESKDYLSKLEKLAARQGELAAQAAVEQGKMRAKFHSILTDEQRQQLQKKREELRQRRLEKVKERRQELQELEEDMAKPAN